MFVALSTVSMAVNVDTSVGSVITPIINPCCVASVLRMLNVSLRVFTSKLNGGNINPDWFEALADICIELLAERYWLVTTLG